jgi:predicted transcriptional regulator YheO
MSQYSPSQLVFSDESAYDKRTLSRRYGWNFKGKRACKHTFFIRGKRYSIEGALCLNGLLAYAIQEGPMNSNDYNHFVEHILVMLLIYLQIYFLIIIFINILFFY